MPNPHSRLRRPKRHHALQHSVLAPPPLARTIPGQITPSRRLFVATLAPALSGPTDIAANDGSLTGGPKSPGACLVAPLASSQVHDQIRHRDDEQAEAKKPKPARPNTPYIVLRESLLLPHSTSVPSAAGRWTILMALVSDWWALLRTTDKRSVPYEPSRSNDARSSQTAAIPIR